MILPDVNVLIYAFRRDLPQHRVCRPWLAAVVSGDAADLDGAMDKHPATPAEVLPARELLADLLLELNNPGAASRNTSNPCATSETASAASSASRERRSNQAIL
jgi:hypothetical protein